MSSTVLASPNFLSLLDAAFDSYTKQTGVDLKQHPGADKFLRCQSPEEVLQLLQERELAFKDYRDQNRGLINSLRPVVQVLHAFSNVLGAAASFVPFQPTGAIFVGVDILFSAAIGVTSSYDALIDLFECVGNFFKRLHIYTEIPLGPAMADILVALMVEVLSVLALATKQIKQGRLKKFAKKLLGESEIEAVLQRLDRLTQEEARTSSAQTLGVVHGLFNNLKVVMDDGKTSMDGIRRTLAEMQEMASEINKIRRDRLQEKIRHWLSPPDPSKNHNIARRDHHDGTAAWFIQGSIFEEWQATGSLLWIHGKPGSGKSILCSSIIQEVEGLRNTGLASMMYFYCDFRDITKQDITGLLTSIIAQLAAKSDPCYSILSDMYSKYDAGSRRPDDDALMECLKTMLQLKGHPTIYIIVDALDESPNTSGIVSPRERVLEFVEELIDLHLQHLRICVTSRPEADVRAILESLASHTISLHDESGQKKDIADYVRSIVLSDRKMRRWRTEDKELVIEILSLKADGMFRWVVCQLETLRRCLPATIRRALDDLPKSLDDTYERTLMGIGQERQEFAQLLFQCLAVSIRPLRVEELAETLAIQFDTGVLPNYNATWRPEDPEEAVLSTCSSLVTIVNVDGTRVVQFSHFSVKEYLTSERLTSAGKHLSCYHIRSLSAHTILAQACLGVLLTLDDKTNKDSMKNFPLAIYAARYWVDHAQFENVSSSIEDAMEHLFDPSKPHFSIWIWIYNMDYPFREMMSTARPTRPEATPLYYATICGFRDIIERLIDSHPQDVNTRGGYHTTPLQSALAKGHVDIMLLLLEHNADVAALDKDDWSPLHHAADRGRLDIVRWLIEHDADVNIQAGDNQGPLSMASRQGDLEIVQLLLQHGAVADHVDDDDWTPLMMASRHGHYDVVLLLLENGAAVELHNDDGATPLGLACGFGHLDVARLLLQNGAAVDPVDNDGMTPLVLASRSGYLDVVRLLLQSDAAVDHCDYDGIAPLDGASEFGYLDVARLLVQSGAEVDIRNGNDWTPLKTASRYGHLDIVRLLLENGAAVDPLDTNGWTPLRTAARYGYLDIVRLLLENGAAVDCHDNDGWTPLMAASRHGHLDIVRLLLQNGAAVESRNDSGVTSLRLASGSGCLDVVCLLLEAGAAVDSCDNEGWTPFSVASRYGHIDVVQHFLDNGADINEREEDLGTPLHLASANGHASTTELLIQRGADIEKRDAKLETPLFRASSNGRLETALLLVKCGSKTNLKNNDGSTPLHTAARNGHLDVVKLLLESGADANIRDGDNATCLDVAGASKKREVAWFLAEHMGVDPRASLARRQDSSSSATDAMASLHAASEEGKVSLVQSLLDRGADINEQNDEHQTPLDVATTNEEIKVVKLLLKRGALVDCRDKEGWTPLHTACDNEYLEIVQLLLDHGADVNATDQDRWAPLHFAANSGTLEIAQLLLERGANVHARNDEGRTAAQMAARGGEREIVRLLSEHGA